MNHSSVMIGGAALLSALASPCVANNMNSSGDGIVSFPLLSHHHVVNRRRRELQAAGSPDDNNYDRIPGLRNRNLAAQQQLGALYQGYGTHYIDIWVGYPAQRQTAVVDTGSSVTAFPCSSCTNCGVHTDSPFDESQSNSFRATHCPVKSNDDGCIFGKCDKDGLCTIEHSFGAPGSDDASAWKAYEAQDVAYAGGPHDRPIDGAAPEIKPGEDELNPIHAPEFSFPLTFGCQTAVSGYFEKQLASGVMGLDRRAQSFWGQMRASQVIHRAQFSLCFVKQPIASISGSTAGAVTLGGVDKRLHKTPMVFAKSVGEGSTASFKVRMRKMYLREGNDQSVMFDTKSKYHKLDITEEGLNGPEMYNFDSGTTDTYLIQSLSNEFRRIWKEVTNMEYSNVPHKVNSDKDLLKLPTLILQLVPHEGGIGDEVQTSDPRTIPGLAGNVDMSMPNDVMLAIPPKHYMQRNSRDGTYSSRIYLDRDDDLGNVLGANSMMGHDILFDMDEARIGFSESECDYARLVAESGSASVGGNDGSSAIGGDVAMGAFSSSEGGDGYKICGTTKCRGMFGLTVAAMFCLFFMFARRYVNKREIDSRKNRHDYDYEMRSNRNLHSTGSLGSYSDSYRTEPTYPSSIYSDAHSGDRGGYHDIGGSYSDRRSNMERSGSRDGERGSERRERRSSRDREMRRSSSRDSADGNNRSSQSIHSHRSHGSGGSGGSGGSRETRQSSRSHRSHRSSGSRESHRSRESNRSGSSRRSSGSRESQRTSGSRSSRHTHGSDRDRRQSSGRSTRYRDEYDDIPMPPTIA